MNGHVGRQRRIVLAALFTAAAVALGFLLAGVPNVELVTLAVFLGGVFCGPAWGTIVGILAIAVHSLLNPLGPPPPQLLAAQMAAYALVGAAGGFCGRRRISGARGAVACAAAGFVLTLVYDVLTTAATALVAVGAGGVREAAWGFFAAGLVFTVVHVGVNTALFAVAVVPILAAARAARGEEAS